MSFNTVTRSCLSVAALAIVAASASTARAQTCHTTLDCVQGFVCIIQPTPPPITKPACPPEGCPTTTTAGASAPADIAAPTNGYCEPAPCTHDSECGTGMLCHTDEIKACSGGSAPAIACAPNSDCAKPAPVPEVCTTTKVSKCAYKWQLPCSTDVECGTGFNCMPSVTATCSGGSATTPTSGATAPGFAAPERPADMCTTMTSFPGSCQPKATTCAADSDCPASWKCVEVQTRDASPGVPVSGGTTGNAGSPTPPSDSKVAPPPPSNGEVPPQPSTMSTKMCQSPLGTYRGETTTTGGNDSGGGTTGEGTSGPVPSVPPTKGGVPATDNSGASPSAGCAVGGAGGEAGFLFVALGLVGIVLARRRK